MTETNETPAADVLAPAARRQLALGGTLLLIVLGTAVGLDRLARSERVIDWLDERNLAHATKTKRIYSYDAGFIDFEDRLTLDEIPSLDGSQGGVYFIGSSNLKWAFSTRSLPADERRLCHNLGIGATNHEMQGQLVRFLVEQKLVLPSKSLFVFAVSYHSAGHLHYEDGFFPSLWRRHGVYTYSKEAGIGLVEQSPWLRAARVERALLPGFLQSLKRQLERSLSAGNVRKHDPAEYNEARRGFMGPDWEEKLATQSAAFVRTALDLKARGAAVSVVLLPQGSWENNLPFHAAYTAKMRALCAENAIPLEDLGNFLDDDDFADSNHFNPSGQRKFGEKAREITREHLRKIGSLP